MGPLEKFIQPALCPLLSSGVALVNRMGLQAPEKWVFSFYASCLWSVCMYLVSCMCSKPLMSGVRAKVVLKETVSDPHFSLLRTGKEEGEILGTAVE